jgi:hypothetical protein
MLPFGVPLKISDFGASREDEKYKKVRKSTSSVLMSYIFAHIYISLHCWCFIKIQIKIHFSVLSDNY